MAKEYRSRTRIILDLLRAIREENPATVTRLLFLANLSHDRLEGYLAELGVKGWIEESGETGRRVWRLTDEGRRMVLELEKVHRFMEDFGLGL